MFKPLPSSLGTAPRAEHLEVSLILDDAKETKKWLDVAPVNSYAAVLQKGGLDEAMNANVLIAAHEAARRPLPVILSILSSIFQYLVLIPIYFVLGIFVYQEVGDAQGLAALGGLCLSTIPTA